MPKKNIHEEIMGFFDSTWNMKSFTNFLHHTIQLFKIYNIDDSGEWEKLMNENEDERSAAVVLTVYFLSRIAEMHAGALVRIKIEHKDLWKRIEKEFDLGVMLQEIDES